MRRATWGYIVLGAAMIAAFLLAPALARDCLYLLSGALAVLAILVGLHRNRPGDRTPWLWLAGGFVIYFVSDVSWEVAERLLDEVPFPFITDVGYLIFYPVVFVAMGQFLKASGTRDRAAWVDAAIWTSGIAVLLWEPLIEPSVVDTSLGWRGYAVALAYPLMDLALLVMVLRLLTGRASVHPAYLLLTAGLLVQVLADAVYGVQVAQEIYVPGEATDVGWMAVNVLVGAAALHPSMVRLTSAQTSPGKLVSQRRLQWLLAPALIAPALLLWQLLSGALAHQPQDAFFTAAATATLLILIVSRGSGLLGMATQRAEELGERSLALEVALDDRERAGLELRSRVDHDTLTGLASRDRFVEALDWQVTRWRTGGPCPSVAFLDLDDFKTVNDTLGHDAGDLLLIEMATRLQNAFGPAHLVARFGGDEFAVLLDGDAEEAAERLLEALRPPLLLNGRELRPEVSIGVTTAAGACTPGDMLREADVAMYTAKRSGGGWARYQSGMSRVLLARLDLRNRLVQALRDGEIQPWFQRIVEIDTGRIIRFEALARWCRPGEPVIGPGKWFIIAEETGLVSDIDRTILNAAIAQWARWRADWAADDLTLAVNLSGRTLQLPGIENEVLEALSLHGVPPNRLIVEVTEGVLIDDDKVGNRLQRLRAAGVRIALDDFGTGWSSLGYLRRFPVDELKLDRSFTQELGKSPEADAIPTAILQLARGLSIAAIAEGVETLEQQHRLSTLGYRLAQGYLFSRAQSAEDCARAYRAQLSGIGEPGATTRSDPLLRLVVPPASAAGPPTAAQRRTGTAWS